VLDLLVPALVRLGHLVRLTVRAAPHAALVAEVHLGEEVYPGGVVGVDVVLRPCQVVHERVAVEDLGDRVLHALHPAVGGAHAQQDLGVRVDVHQLLVVPRRRPVHRGLLAGEDLLPVTVALEGLAPLRNAPLEVHHHVAHVVTGHAQHLERDHLSCGRGPRLSRADQFHGFLPPVGRLRSAAYLAATARDEGDGGGDPAADHEARHRGADQRRAAVADQLAAPVGQLGHLGAQVVHREGELLARRLDLGADHLRRPSSCHYAFTSSPRSSVRCTWSRSIFCASSSARVRLASSIAMSGVGGEPFLNSRYASRPARIANRNSTAVTTAKPAQTLSSQLKTSSRNHAIPWKNMVMPKTRNTPAAAATPAPRVIFDTLSVTSAFASSISSRTSCEAFSETSATISPSDLSAPSGGGIPFVVIG